MVVGAGNNTMTGESTENSGIITKTLLSTGVNSVGQSIIFPQGPGYVDAAIYEIAPGAFLPIHKHPFPRMGYILSGTLRVTNLETNETVVYEGGDFSLESVDKWHKGDNPGTEPVRLLVIDLIEAGSQNTIVQ
jgi:quercetin dioxygenase-like cupin family protein